MTSGLEPCPSSAPSSSSQEIVVPSAATATLPTGLPFGPSVAATTAGAYAKTTGPIAVLTSSASSHDGNSERYSPHHSHHRSHQNPPPVRQQQRNGHDRYRGRDERGRNNDDRADRSRSQGSHRRRYRNSSSYRESRRHHSPPPRDHSHRSRRREDRDHHNADHYRPAYSNNPTITESRSLESVAQKSTREKQCRFGYPSASAPNTDSVGNTSDSSETESLEKTLKKIELKKSIKAALLETRKIEMQLGQIIVPNHDNSLQVNAAAAATTTTTMPPPFAQTSFARDTAPPFAASARDAAFASTRGFNNTQPFAQLHAASTRPFTARESTTFPNTQQPRPSATIGPGAATAHHAATIQPFAMRETTPSTTRQNVAPSFATIAPAAATANTVPARPFAARETTTQWPFATFNHAAATTQAATSQPFTARDSTLTTTQWNVAHSFATTIVPAAATTNTVPAQPFAARETTTQWPFVRSFATTDPAATAASPFAVRDTTLTDTQSSMPDGGACNDGSNDNDDVDFSPAMDSSDEDTIAERGTATRMGESTVRTNVVAIISTVTVGETAVTTDQSPKDDDIIVTVGETAVTTDQSSKDDDIVDVSATFDSAEDDEQEHSTQATPAPRRKRPHSGRGTLARNLKRKLREAQRADDEAMKHTLLKAWEDDMAALQSEGKRMHHHTEKDLMSTFIPKIVGHFFLNGGEVAKYLVQWNRSEHDLISDKGCLSWVTHEDFLFSALARKYLEENVKDLGSAWMKKCDERENCLTLLNTSSIDADEYESQVEIDFCCYLCKCPWAHPMKNTLRSCENGLKFHRGCCHGYQDSAALESFVSPVGEVIGKLFDGDNDEETNCVGESGNHLVERTDSILEVSDGDCSMYSRCLLDRKAMRDVAVLCLNAGVGSATVSLKALGISIGKIIHVDADRVAQHVYRSHHDIRYGETETDDGIEHVVGLYENFHDVADDAENFVLLNGPIDIIICLSAHEESKDDNIQFVSNFLALMDDIERFNRQHHQVDHLFYLFEVPSGIKDDLPPHKMSLCVSDHNILLCNWPILFENFSPATGSLQDNVFKSVSKLFDSLREALFAGPFDKMWRDVIHPKYWTFLGMGPGGYDLKLQKKELDLKAFLLRLTSPSSSDLLSAVDYSNHLLAATPPVSLLIMLLHPMKSIFNDKQYGHGYDELIPERGNKCEHGRTSGGNDSSAVKSDEDWEIATYDEAALFDEVDKSIAL